MLRLAIEATEKDEATPIGAPARWDRGIASLLGPRGRLAALTASLVLALSLIVVGDLHGILMRRVHARPEYSWSLSRVEILPTPPPWLPGGREGMLVAVSRSLSGLDGRSALELDLDALERAFKHVRWVDRVVSVRRSYPDRIAVEVIYRRRPVATVRVSEPGGFTDYVVDEAGTIFLQRFPGDDEDLGASIRLGGIAPPRDGTPGTVWELPAEIGAAGADGGANPVVVSSAALARFLLEETEENGPFTAPDGTAMLLDEIWPLGPENVVSMLREEAEAWGEDPRSVDDSPGAILRAQSLRLFLKLRLPDGPSFWVFWQAPPGSEGDDREPSADEKVRMLREWLASPEPSFPPPDGALIFSARGPIWNPPL
ncbi:cell division protein FtsQ/DivIB [Tautonia sociabilis]|uniref:FtsQ-type POTRA domain-containing protein n=1 Tax=Tautonia sociabilis TaxID=2080755 RepID=A0A432MQL9_9BACT|nr:hypothetical protein [Tautonia sociabilis]RUL89549.1 hypothetical protein TsocGM_01905 [Tautonia sociabilis]